MVVTVLLVQVVLEVVVELLEVQEEKARMLPALLAVLVRMVVEQVEMAVQLTRTEQQAIFQEQAAVELVTALLLVRLLEQVVTVRSQFLGMIILIWPRKKEAQLSRAERA
jgi:hypothetical protein